MRNALNRYTISNIKIVEIARMTHDRVRGNSVYISDKILFIISY